jgi:hypothetical protein
VSAHLGEDAAAEALRELRAQALRQLGVQHHPPLLRGAAGEQRSLLAPRPGMGLKSVSTPQQARQPSDFLSNCSPELDQVCKESALSHSTRLDLQPPSCQQSLSVRVLARHGGLRPLGREGIEGGSSCDVSCVPAFVIRGVCGHLSE